MESLEVVKLIKQFIDEKLGEDIICLDLREISSITDFLLIATGKADTHVKAISNFLIDEMKKQYGIRPLAVEGLNAGTWACIDYGDIIVHIMREYERQTYDLQAIWGEASRV